MTRYWLLTAFEISRLYTTPLVMFLDQHSWPQLVRELACGSQICWWIWETLLGIKMTCDSVAWREPQELKLAFFNCLRVMQRRYGYSLSPRPMMIFLQKYFHLLCHGQLQSFVTQSSSNLCMMLLCSYRCLCLAPEFWVTKIQWFNTA